MLRTRERKSKELEYRDRGRGSRLGERQLNSVSWMSYEMQIANQLHSFILFITFMIKSCVASFAFRPPSATCCLSPMPGVCSLAYLWTRLTFPMFTLPPKQRTATLSTTLHCDVIHRTSGAHAHSAVTHVYHQSSTGTTATLCGVVRSREWQLCELCGTLPLSSYRPHTTEKHPQKWANIERISP